MCIRDRGRIAAARAFDDHATTSNPSFYPYGIYTIPEISFIGKTEEQLTDEEMCIRDSLVPGRPALGKSPDLPVRGRPVSL